jgi:hypothetical protein
MRPLVEGPQPHAGYRPLLAPRPPLALSQLPKLLTGQLKIMGTTGVKIVVLMKLILLTI